MMFIGFQAAIRECNDETFTIYNSFEIILNYVINIFDPQRVIQSVSFTYTTEIDLELQFQS